MVWKRGAQKQFYVLASKRFDTDSQIGTHDTSHERAEPNSSVHRRSLIGAQEKRRKYV